MHASINATTGLTKFYSRFFFFYTKTITQMSRLISVSEFLWSRLKNKHTMYIKVEKTHNRLAYNTIGSLTHNPNATLQSNGLTFWYTAHWNSFEGKNNCCLCLSSYCRHRGLSVILMLLLVFFSKDFHIRLIFLWMKNMPRIENLHCLENKANITDFCSTREQQHCFNSLFQGRQPLWILSYR